MRIGTNHGSLSDRILSRYGDTPLGMVESAMEFIRICRDHDFHDIVISMKASNTQVMVQAYRLLVNHMMKEDMSYPLHLGVTEAGDGAARKFRFQGIQEGWAWAERAWSQVTNDTGVGDPRKATAAKGEKYFNALTEKIAKYLEEVARTDKRDFYS